MFWQRGRHYRRSSEMPLGKSRVPAFNSIREKRKSRPAMKLFKRHQKVSTHGGTGKSVARVPGSSAMTPRGTSGGNETTDKPSSMTTKERVEREKQRREEANKRMREKVAAARRRGLCRCGGKLDKKPGSRRNYSTCPDCRAKAARYYVEGPMHPKVKPPTKLDGRLRDSTGVRRRLERDGFGREAWWWFASAFFNGKQQCRRWSVDKYGDHGAWKLARAQRREWEKSA